MSIIRLTYAETYSILGISKTWSDYENGEIFQHFGHTEQFMVSDVESGKIVSPEVVGDNDCGHGALSGVLKVHRAF